MKVLTKITSLVGLLSALAANAGAVEEVIYVDNSQLVCTVILPGGEVLFGNGKNDHCILYEGVEGVEIIYHNNQRPHSHAPIFSVNTDEFQCMLDNGEEISIKKEILRVDNYKVEAFGYTFFGIDGSTLGILDGLLVQNQSVGMGEPSNILFSSDTFGNPTSIAVHILGGRAPSVYKTSCEQVN